MILREYICEVLEEYRGEHGAPDRESGSPLFDLTKNETYPADVYSLNGVRYYGAGTSRDSIVMNIIYRAHNKPNNRIKIYRAVPDQVGMEQSRERLCINPGDWVTIDRPYAVGHGQGPLNNQYKILSKTVRVSELYTNGDSLFEWGWDP